MILINNIESGVLKLFLKTNEPVIKNWVEQILKLHVIRYKMAAKRGVNIGRGIRCDKGIYKLYMLARLFDIIVLDQILEGINVRDVRESQVSLLSLYYYCCRITQREKEWLYNSWYPWDVLFMRTTVKKGHEMRGLSFLTTPQETFYAPIIHSVSP